MRLAHYVNIVAPYIPGAMRRRQLCALHNGAVPLLAYAWHGEGPHGRSITLVKGRNFIHRGRLIRQRLVEARCVLDEACARRLLRRLQGKVDGLTAENGVGETKISLWMKSGTPEECAALRAMADAVGHAQG